jgi:hypothetical protein
MSLRIIEILNHLKLSGDTFVAVGCIDREQRVVGMLNGAQFCYKFEIPL